MRLGRTVAIKILPNHLSDSPELKQRFEREARAISSLNHPHICHLCDIGSHDGTEFQVMEFLDGQTLAERLRKGAMPLPELLTTATQIAEALETAHRAGIVRRDLKPGNIMLTKAGAKLMDFGLAKPMLAAPGVGSAPLLSAAKTMSANPMSRLTTAGTLVGTIQYMSPEQIEGKDADARSDIFAFGAVLYEMATGKRAFEGKNQISVASAILEKDPEAISKIKPLSPAALDYQATRRLLLRFQCGRIFRRRELHFPCPVWRLVRWSFLRTARRSPSPPSTNRALPSCGSVLSMRSKRWCSIGPKMPPSRSGHTTASCWPPTGS